MSALQGLTPNITESVASHYLENKDRNVEIYSRSVSNGNGTQYVVMDNGKADAYVFSGSRYIGKNLVAVREQDNSVRFVKTNPEALPQDRRNVMRL